MKSKMYFTLTYPGDAPRGGLLVMAIYPVLCLETKKTLQPIRFLQQKTRLYTFSTVENTVISPRENSVILWRTMTSNSRFRQPGNLFRPNQLINSPKHTVAYREGRFSPQNIDDFLFSGIPINSANEQQIMLICRQVFLLIKKNDLEIYGR